MVHPHRADVLAAHGIEHFDAWASTFAQTQTVFEMTPDRLMSESF